MHRLKSIVVIILVGLLLSACSSAAQIESTPTATPGPINTATPAPTQTLTATFTLTPTITPTVTPAHALSIEYLHQQTYSAALTIEEEVDHQTTYTRYVASYLSEGNKNYALFTIPDGDPPENGWPVIVFNHGYIEPELYSTIYGYESYVQAFADHGYIVLRPDYRGHGMSEGEPQNSYFTQATTIDVLNAVAAVKNWETADPENIGMWGHSMGGWITMRALASDPDIRAGVIWGGAIGSYDDLCVHWFNCANWDEATWAFWTETPFYEYGLPEENEVFWAAASVDTNLSNLGAAVQLHHSTTDSVVPVGLSRAMYEKMRAASVDVELYEYASDDHNISQNFTTAMSRSLDFFDQHLKDGNSGTNLNKVREKDGMEMVYVPAGMSQMGDDDGSKDEQPEQEIYLDASWIDKYEVTNGQYSICVQEGVCTKPGETKSFTREYYYGAEEFDNFPVAYVDWYQASEYCQWAGGSLPTEAQWEKAARGSDGRTYPWGEKEPTCDLANFKFADKECVGDTTSVGSYPKGVSLYGALDMAGNVWEWIADRYSGIAYAYMLQDNENPTGPDNGDYRVIRGGSYLNQKNSIRSFDRFYAHPVVSWNDIGFRCVIPADTQ